MDRMLWTSQAAPTPEREQRGVVGWVMQLKSSEAAYLPLMRTLVRGGNRGAMQGSQEQHRQKCSRGVRTR